MSHDYFCRFALDKANGELGQRFDEMESLLKQEHLEVRILYIWRFMYLKGCSCVYECHFPKIVTKEVLLVIYYVSQGIAIPHHMNI